jgi:hypothetical protein
MDLLNKVEEITMTNLSILYNTNLVPLVICVLPPLGELEQQGSNVEKKLQEKDTSIPARRKKKGKKTICKVVIKAVTMRSSGSLLFPRSSQSHVARKTRMVDKEQRSNDVLTCLDICFVELSESPPIGREDDVKDVDDDDIGEEMNKQVPFKDLSPIKAR